MSVPESRPLPRLPGDCPFFSCLAIPCCLPTISAGRQASISAPPQPASGFGVKDGQARESTGASVSQSFHVTPRCGAGSHEVESGPSKTISPPLNWGASRQTCWLNPIGSQTPCGQRTLSLPGPSPSVSPAVLSLRCPNGSVPGTRPRTSLALSPPHPHLHSRLGEKEVQRGRAHLAGSALGAVATELVSNPKVAEMYLISVSMVWGVRSGG